LNRRKTKGNPKKRRPIQTRRSDASTRRGFVALFDKVHGVSHIVGEEQWPSGSTNQTCAGLAGGRGLQEV